MSVDVYLGRGAFVGLAEEVTWGTAVSPRTHFFRILSASLMRKVNKEGRAVLAQGVAARRFHFTKEDLVEGDIEIEMAYEGIGLWLKHALGSTATTGTNPYTHTYSQASALPTGLTIEQAAWVGDDASVLSEVFEGCLINSWRARIAVGEIARLTASIIGETSSARGAASTPTYTANDVPMLHHQFGSLTFNSVTYTKVKSIEIQHDNSLGRRMLLGSTVTKRPQRSDFAKTVMRVTAELADSNLITAYTADTQGDVAVSFTGTGGRSSTWTVHNAYLTDHKDAVTGPGVVERTYEFTGESDGTDEGIAIQIVNTQSTAIAA
jgi:hypothetical protein